MSSAKKIIYVINGLPFFMSRLADLARAAQDLGYEVHVAAPASGEADRLEELGFSFHPVPFTRSGTGPLSEARTFIRLKALYDRLEPSLIHHFTIKPVIYGGLAARWSGVPAQVSTLTGLGFVFTSRRLKARVLKPSLQPLLRLALNGANSRTVFQNPDDQRFFVERGLVRPGRTALICGTGVDISRFSPLPEPNNRPLVLFASRMLLEKGVVDFVRMAEQLLGEGVWARFVMVGDSDAGNPSSIPRSRLREWAAKGRVEWWGQRSDIPSLLNQAGLVCLPSYYGEGVPRILVEAAASARATVTFDTPGCREIVQHAVNGILVPVGDMQTFTQEVKRILGDPQGRSRMGRKGREIVEKKFTRQMIIDQNLDIYRELTP